MLTPSKCGAYMKCMRINTALTFYALKHEMIGLQPTVLWQIFQNEGKNKNQRLFDVVCFMLSFIALHKEIRP